MNSKEAITFATGCSGIGAPEVAFESLGWKALWNCEIEPFPSAVLKYHWPDVPNAGDFMTLEEKIRRKELEAPDVFVAGTPCQAFSVAGLRKSFGDKRGGLTLEYIRIADAVDDVWLGDGKSAGIFLWENVPGVLNTKDNAFGCFLAGMAGADEPILPPDGKRFPNAGVVRGPKREVAYRVLDAQYFGVAQRRRRVFALASSRTGFSPAEALLEFGSVPRNTPPSRKAREDVAGEAQSGAGTSVCINNRPNEFGVERESALSEGFGL